MAVLRYKKTKRKKLLRHLAPVYTDSCLYKYFQKFPQPKKILLLGSGTSSTPDKWLDIPSVCFNSRAIKYYKNRINPIIVLYNRGQYRRTKRACRIYKDIPLFVSMESSLSSNQSSWLKENRCLLGCCNDKYIGQWYSECWDKAISIRKKITVGFWGTMWLLWGKQKEIYISGFDAVQHMLNNQYKDFNYFAHDLNLEWTFWEQAIKICEKRGIKTQVNKSNISLETNKQTVFLDISRQISLEFVTTACIRPSILYQTYYSFTSFLKGVDFKTSTLYLNIDPVPDGNPEDMIQVAKQFFGKVIPNTPSSPQFTKAVKWCWSQPKGNFFFYLQDDWLLIEDIDIQELISKLNTKLDNNKLSIGVSLRWRRRQHPFSVTLTPSLYLTGWGKKAAYYMKDSINPEIGCRKYIPVNCSGFQFPHNPPNVVLMNIGRKWREERNIITNSSCHKYFTGWTCKQETVK